MQICFVNIMKVYIERNSLPIELIRFRKKNSVNVRIMAMVVSVRVRFSKLLGSD